MSNDGQLKFFDSNSKAIFFALTTFLFFISLAFYVTFKAHEDTKHVDQVKKLTDDFENTFESFSHPLQGIVAQIHFSNFNYTPDSFRNAAEARDLYKNFSGALGFGFIRKIESSEISEYLTKQNRFNPDFQLKRLSEKPKLDNPIYVIEAVEPIEVNRKALGLVVSDESRRKAAAEASGKSGRLSITMPIQLVQANRKEPGFLAFLPIYKTPQVPSTEAERIASLVGWAYSPILASSIIDQISKQNPDLELISAFETSEDQYEKIFGPDGSHVETTEDFLKEKISAIGKNWMIVFKIKKTYTWSPATKSIVIFFVCFCILFSAFAIRANQFQKNQFKKDLITETSNAASKAVEKIVSENEVEKQRQARLFSQAKLSLLGEMCGGIAHEINNPLAILKSKLVLIQRKIEAQKLEPQSLSRIEHHLQDADKMIDRISTIIKSMKSISRDSENDEFIKVTLNEIIEEVRNLISEKIKLRGVRFELPENLEAFSIKCNKIQIEQVLINLISNSLYEVQNTKDSWIKVEAKEFQNFVQIRVIDSGKGISSEIESKIMEPFFTTKPVGSGTGLGLSISKSLIDLHDGSLKYDLYHDNTSFLIELPLETNLQNLKSS